jgi:hypothetical protein
MDFLDDYEILQISPNAEAETIHRVFRISGGSLSPDNPETGDSAKFIRLRKPMKCWAIRRRATMTRL